MQTSEGARTTSSKVQLAIVLATPALTMLTWANLSPVLPLIQTEFGIDNTMVGLVSSITVLAHMLFQVPGGRLTDIFSSKFTIRLGTLICALAVGAAGLSASFPMLLTLRFVIGIGTGISFVAGLAMVATLAPAEKRSLAQGAYTACAASGFLIALLTSERLTSLIGWRNTLIIEGIIILAYVLIAQRLLPLKKARQAAVSVPWTDSVRQPTLYFLGLAQISAFAIHVALVSWAAVFFWQQHNIGLEWAGPLAALLNVTAAIGCVVGGIISAGRERLVILFACFASAIGLVVLPQLPTVPLAVLFILLLGLSSNIPNGPAFAYPSRVLGRPDSATDISIINFLANVGSFSFPVLIGSALDTTQSFSTAFGITGAIAFACASAAALWLLRPGQSAPVPAGRSERA